MVSVERATGLLPKALEAKGLIISGRQAQMAVFDGVSQPGNI
jgi:hypothetical protein